MSNVSTPLPSTESKLTFSLEPGASPGHTKTLQQTIDHCSAQGGGTVVLKAGIHHSGTIHLRSKVTLHLEKDAVLFGSPDIADYYRREGTPGARIMLGVATALVWAEGAEDIAITGEGTIDGNAHAFWKKNENIPAWVEEKKRLGTWIPGFTCSTRDRPRALVLLVDCRRVLVENIRVQSSPAWTLHFLACTDLTVRDITLRGDVYGSNTDGIDLDACSNVLVENCDIQTGDDAIALKNTNGWGFKRPSRNITVRGCRLASTTHGFTIGTETEDDFEDIALLDTRIEQSDGHRTLTGLGLSTFDGGSVRRLRVSNVTISDAIAPIQIRLGNVGRGQTTTPHTVGMLEDITLENITIHRAHGNNTVLGLPGHPLRRVTLRNIKLEFTGLVESAEIVTTVPIQSTEFPLTHVWRYLPVYGFFCRDVEGLELSDITFTVPAAEKRPELHVENVTGLVKSNIQVVTV